MYASAVATILLQMWSALYDIAILGQLVPVKQLKLYLTSVGL